VITGVVLAATIVVGSGAVGAIPGLRRWQISPSPQFAEGYTLAGVSCASATSCVAVGALARGVDFEALIETWDGASWTVTPNPFVSPTLYLLNGVSCPEPTTCVAVGKFLTPSGVEHTLIETRAGGEWSVTPSPNPDVSQTLNGVSCTSAAECVAVGTSTDGERERALVEEWNGTDWSVVPTPRPRHTPVMVLSGVSCVTATSCVAAGSAASDLGTQPLIERWNGTKWSLATVPYPDGTGNNQLSGVSCASGNRCVVVGSSAALNGPLIEMWDGTSWSIAERPNPGTGGDALAGVSCPSRTRCVATGSFNSDKRKQLPRNLVEAWNGTAWTVVPSVSHLGQPDSLAGVSCPSTATCMAVGVTYAEPVQNAFILTGRP
jgi:hypothetical protein